MERINFGNQNIKKHDTYNDGFIYFGIIKILRNDKKEKIGEEIEIRGKRPFEYMSIRDSDNNIADSLGYTIDKKVKIPFSNLPENIKIKINNDDTLYEVKKRDSSDRRNIYLYLQKVSNQKENK